MDDTAFVSSMPDVSRRLAADDLLLPRIHWIGRIAPYDRLQHIG